jgi:hypothetical protein
MCIWSVEHIYTSPNAPSIRQDDETIHIKTAAPIITEQPVVAHGRRGNDTNNVKECPNPSSNWSPKTWNDAMSSQLLAATYFINREQQI